MILWQQMEPKTNGYKAWWRRNKCTGAARDGNGKCLGWSPEGDDEPGEECKHCTEYTSWDEMGV